MPTSRGCRKNANGNHVTCAVHRPQARWAVAVKPLQWRTPGRALWRALWAPSDRPVSRLLPLRDAHGYPVHSPLTSHWAADAPAQAETSAPKQCGGPDGTETMERGPSPSAEDRTLPFAAQQAPWQPPWQTQSNLRGLLIPQGARSPASQRARAPQTEKEQAPPGPERLGTKDSRQELPHRAHPPASNSTVLGSAGWETRRSPRATLVPAISAARRFLMTGQGGHALGRCKPHSP